MRKLLTILTFILGISACKKEDIKIPIEENPLKGKLKSMRIEESLFGRDTVTGIYSPI